MLGRPAATACTRTAPSGRGRHFQAPGSALATGFVRHERTAARKTTCATALRRESGLLNQRGFAERCAGPADGERRVAVFRIEEFRRFSVAYGERWSIATLQEIAARLQATLGPHEAAGRVREDSFALWLGADAGSRIETLAAALRQPYALDTTCLLLTVTFGLSCCEGELDELLRTAQWACDRSGAAGRIMHLPTAGSNRRCELGIESRRATRYAKTG